jgi:hypothetical protein
MAVINAGKIHQGYGMLWLPVCAPAPGQRLLVDASGTPLANAWPGATSPVVAGLEIVGGGNIWRCTTGGTTGATEPTWPPSPSVGQQQTDGSAVWEFVVSGPANQFQGAVTGATTFTTGPKTNLIEADNETAPIDVVMSAEDATIEATMMESDLAKLKNYLAQGTYATGTDTGLPMGSQAYEEIAFGGLITIPKFSVALISPRRDVQSRYVVAQLYRAASAEAVALGFTKSKETTYKVKFQGLAVGVRPIGDRVGKIYRQV